MSDMKNIDPEIYDVLQREYDRQHGNFELIASELSELVSHDCAVLLSWRNVYRNLWVEATAGSRHHGLEPDMQLPIQYALGYPGRLKSGFERYDFARGDDLTFHSPDIENFRNLKFVECSEVADFMVICGGNGCGKSSLLEALMTAKEYAGAYGNFQFDPMAVTADAEKATITLVLKFTEKEREFVRKNFNFECPETDEIIVEINKGGSGRATKRSPSAKKLLSHYRKIVGNNAIGHW